MSAVVTPIAPSFIACATSAFIVSSSAGVGARFVASSTYSRTVGAPRKLATFGAKPRFSR